MCYTDVAACERAVIGPASTKKLESYSIKSLSPSAMIRAYVGVIQSN